MVLAMFNDGIIILPTNSNGARDLMCPFGSSTMRAGVSGSKKGIRDSSSISNLVESMLGNKISEIIKVAATIHNVIRCYTI